MFQNKKIEFFDKIIDYMLNDEKFLLILPNLMLDNESKHFLQQHLQNNHKRDEKNINNNNNNNEIYHKCWKIIHSMHHLESKDQLYLFFKILNIISENKCSCTLSAFEIFVGLLNGNIDNFLELNDKKSFWFIFHNVINMKLSKNLHPLYQ